MKANFPGISVLGGGNDNVPNATEQLANNQELILNGLKVTCYHTPCHTRGHMLYLFEPVEGPAEG